MRMRFVKTLVAVFGLLAMAACTTTPESANGVRLIRPGEVNAIRTAHVDALNAFRQSQGRRAVQLDSALTAAAATHARDMSVQRRAWHFGSDGTSPRDRALRARFNGRVVGENISESFDDGVSVFQSWLNDGFTRSVMLDPSADAVGIAFYQESNGKLWWVQVLGQSAAAGGQADVSVTPGS